MTKRFQFEDMAALKLFSHAVMQRGRDLGHEYAMLQKVLPMNHTLVGVARDALKDSLSLTMEVNQEIHRLHVLGRCTDEDCKARNVKESEEILHDSLDAAEKLYARLNDDQTTADALPPLSDEDTLATSKVAGMSLLPTMLAALGANVIFVDEDETGAATVVSHSESGQGMYL